MIDPKNICVGDVLVLSTDMETLVDCMVLAGEVVVDQSCMTGESMPVRKRRGDVVISGCTIVCGRFVGTASKSCTFSNFLTV
jgi:P-type E1-E2 ATPase